MNLLTKMRIYINIHRPDEAFDLKSEYILVSTMVNLLIKKIHLQTSEVVATWQNPLQDQCKDSHILMCGAIVGTLVSNCYFHILS